MRISSCVWWPFEREIPETFDLGTVSVELTCIASSSKFIILGTGCGTLFVYNKKLGRLARPLRTNSFEAVTCVHHLSLLDDYVVVGHNTGTLIAMRLPSGREGASTSLAQCIDNDSHRRSPITCVRISADTQKIVSGDASGTVILSTVIFETVPIRNSLMMIILRYLVVFRVGEIGCIVSAAWNLEGTILGVLSSSNVLIMFDLLLSRVLWRAPLNDHICCSVGDFCVDDDDSILYITKPRGVHRVGVSTAAKFLAEADTDSPVASLLSSPKKLLSSSALRVTQKGFSFINNAINAAKDISSGYEVSNLMEDALKILDGKDDAQNLTQDFLSNTNREDLSGTSSLGDFTRDANKVPVTEDTDVFVKRKEKIRCKKENHMESPDVYDHRDTSQRTIDEETILALRREVLGNSVLSSSPCGSGISIESPPTWSPRDSPHISGLHMKSSDSTKASSTPSSSRDSPPGGSRKLLPPDAEADETSQSDGEEDLSKPAELTEPVIYSEVLPHGADSVATAYEYLLLKSSSKPETSKVRPSVPTDSSAVQHRLVLQERSRKNVVLNDQVDIWIKVFLPYTAKSFTVGRQHIVLCHRRKTPRIITLDDLGSKKSNWQAAKWAADSVSMNGEFFFF
ncbi:hypothetical protein ANCCAN_07537, partial [Ancylostoma caninum]